MALMDRLREAWDDLRNNHKEQQEPVLIEPSGHNGPVHSTRETASAVDPSEVTEKNVQDIYLAAKREVEPVLQSVAEEHYRGRLDLVGEEHEFEVVYEVAERTGLPLEMVREATSDVLLDAYIDQKRVSSERLDPAVGEEHSNEFRLREKDGEVWTFDHRPTGQQIHLDAYGGFHDLEEGRPPTAVSRDEILERFQKTPESAQLETQDHRRQWETLEKAVGYQGADNFEHYSQQGDMSVYRQEVEERDRFVGLDSKGRFYQVDQSSFTPIARISRDEALERMDAPANFFTPAEPTPTHKDWSRLEQAVGQDNATDFTFRGESSGIQNYQHDSSGNHVRMDSAGQFHNAEGQPITREAAIAHALPSPAVEASQAMSDSPGMVRAEGLGREQSIGMEGL